MQQLPLENLAEFKLYCDSARAAGKKPPTLMLEDYQNYAYTEDGYTLIFEMHSFHLMYQALDLLGIPYEGV